MSKTLYQSELVKLGPVTVRVESDILKSKYDGKPDYVVLALNGTERLYNLENHSCGDAFHGRKGQTITIQATGSRDEASISIVDDGDIAPVSRPTAAPARAAAPAAKSTPHGATVGMAINCACANLTARGEFLDGEAVTQIASDLLRVAAWLEAGNLLPKRAAACDNDGGAA